MLEWLMLAIVAPAIIVPVVLLAGFAGCGFHVTIDAPYIMEAVGASGTRIDLRVRYSTPVQGFEIERTNMSDQAVDTFTVDETTVDTFEAIDASNYLIKDRELQPATTYLYRLRAIKTDGHFSNSSNTAQTSVAATTFDYLIAFAWTMEERAAARDSMAWEGYTLVQRIDPSRLGANGEYVKITLRASSAGSASIEKVYISQPDERAGMDPYDSGPDLTEVASTRIVIQPNDTATTLPVRYHFDEARPLLVIVEFSPSPPSAVRSTDAVQPGAADLYYKEALGEAMLADRTGYTTAAPPSQISLIDKIEVA